MTAYVPHFAFPFRFGGPAAAVTEQDSLDEIGDCCTVVLLCPQGFRVELMEFGLPDPTFSSPDPDLNDVHVALDQWEPRAAATLDQSRDLVDEAVSYIRAQVALRTEE